MVITQRGLTNGHDKWVEKPSSRNNKKCQFQNHGYIGSNQHSHNRFKQRRAVNRLKLVR